MIDEACGLAQYQYSGGLTKEENCLLQWRQLGTEVPVTGIEHKATAASTMRMIATISSFQDKCEPGRFVSR